MEGLRFTSSLYTMLIWLRGFQWVLNNPKSVKEKLNPTLTNFRSFFDDPSAVIYIEKIIRHMAQNELQRLPPTKSLGKRRLAELLNSDEDDSLNLPGPNFLEQRNELLSDDSQSLKRVSQSLKKRRARKAKKSKKN